MGRGDPKRFLFWVGGGRRRNRAPGDGALGFFSFSLFRIGSSISD